MRPGTALSGRKPLPGFDSRRNDTRPPSAASKTRPLKRSLSTKAAPLLLKSDFNVLLPPELTMKKLNPQAKAYVKANVLPMRQVNTFQLFQALRETINDTKDVMELVRSASNLSMKIMRRNSLHLQRERPPPKAKVQPGATYPQRQLASRSRSRDLVGLMREFARLRYAASLRKDSNTIVVEPKPPQRLIPPAPKPQVEEEIHPSFELRVSIDSLARSEQSRVQDDSVPQYTFVSQFIEQLAPKDVQEPLKKKLRGRLVRLKV